RIVPLNVAQATLGTKLAVSTLDDRQVSLTVPAGTSSGKRFRIRGQGIVSGERTGDLLIEAKVVAPERLTDEQAALMRRFAEAADLEL
ncbi:MAG: DnaJ C-terminal domain-containing protein, partial [Gemmatimonadota bacterium]